MAVETFSIKFYIQSGGCRWTPPGTKFSTSSTAYKMFSASETQKLTYKKQQNLSVEIKK
jgi:hypothetical protein